jgi:hypothetical protein
MHHGDGGLALSKVLLGARRLGGRERDRQQPYPSDVSWSAMWVVSISGGPVPYATVSELDE